MKTIKVKIEIAGHVWTIDIDPAEILNDLKKEYGSGVFYDTVCDTFNRLDIDHDELADLQIAHIRPKVVELTKNVKLHYEQIAKDFFNWAVETEVDYKAHDFSIDTIWKQFLIRP